MELKKCSLCGELKDVEQFRMGKGGWRSSHCHPCAREYIAKWRADNAERLRAQGRLRRQRMSEEELERKRELDKARYHQDPGRARDYYLRKTYGISLERYQEMESAQDGRCRICGETCPSGRALAVDHCHTSGEVRGLLCGQCNNGLGRFKDRPDLLRAAADYLESANEGASA